VAARIGFGLHDGQLHLHPFGRCHYHDSGAADSRQKTLTQWQNGELRIEIIMKTQHATHRANQTEEDGEHLMEDAQALLAATAHVAEEKVVEARKRLTAAIEKGKETWNNAREKAAAGAKAADQVIRDHPYQSIGVALGVGTLIGFLLSRRN
jgi:ElaB/YqjD/DUF883 family membrane-anchored ribosome-binding protein